MQKSRIEIRADFATHIDTCKMAWLEVEDERHNLSNMADNNREARIDSPNVGLVEFGI